MCVDSWFAGVERNLYDDAFLSVSGSSKKSCTSCMFENFPYAIVHLGGTFKIPCRSNFTSNRFSLQRVSTTNLKVGVRTSSGLTGRC